MFDWVVVGGCAVGVARGCSDPRCAENRVQSRVPEKNREMGGLQHYGFNHNLAKSEFRFIHILDKIEFI